MGIGRIIKDGRRKMGLTQSDLAKYLGSTQKSVQFWESEKTIPSGDVLIKIAEKLEIAEQIFPNKNLKQQKEDSELLEIKQEMRDMKMMIRLLTEKIERTEKNNLANLKHSSIAADNQS